MAPWSHSPTFQLGNAQYVKRPACKLKDVETQLNGPFTIIRIPEGQKVDTSFFKRKVQTFLDEDDVFSVDFLHGIVFLRIQKAEPDEKQDVTPKEDINLSSLSERWRATTKDWNIKWMTSISLSEEVPEGPYLADKTGNHEVWRVHDDINNAFVLSVWPKTHQSQFNGEIEFQNTHLAGYATRSLGIAVPSRLYFVPTAERPFNGLRVAVKDIVHMKGVPTSCCSRAYSELYSASKITSSSIAKLVALGAQIVGKTHLSALALKEEPGECVDYSAPFNPRGDGYQSPAGSSSGSGAAIAAYEWLDFTVGTDTTGSGRRPALWNGCFSIRPTSEALAQDGCVLTMPQFDTLMYFTRDIRLMRIIAQHWYNRPFIPRTIEEPRSNVLLYPTDYLPVDNLAQMKLLDKFVEEMALTMDVRLVEINIGEEWARSAPVPEKRLNIWLKGIVEHGFYYDAYVHFQQFREDYHAKFGTEPYVSDTNLLWWSVGSIGSEEQHHVAMSKFDIYRKWFLKHIFQVDRQEAFMVLPIEKLEPRYRDDPVVLQREFPKGINTLFLSPALGTPEIVVPCGEVDFESRITKRRERLPMALSILSPPETDHRLIGWIEEFLDKAGKRPYVTTGKSMYGESVPNSPDIFHKVLDKLTLEASKSDLNGPTKRRGSPTNHAIIARTPYYGLGTLKRDSHFFGREVTLSKLDSSLLRSTEPFRGGRIILSGAGGIGKTMIAKEFALSRKDHFDVVIWISCDNTVRVSETVISAVEKLGLSPEGRRLTYTSCRDLLDQWLSHPFKNTRGDLAKWLLILDNIDQIGDVGNLFLARSSGSILITTRELTRAGFGPSDRCCQVEIEPFDNDATARLLLRLTENEEDTKNQGALHAVARELKGHSLTILQVAAMIKKRKITFLDALMFLKQQKMTKTDGRSVDTIFAAAIESLDDGGRTLLKVISLLDSSSVTEDILETEDDASSYPRGEAYSKAVQALCTAGLVHYDATQHLLITHYLVRVEIHQCIEDPRGLFSIAVGLVNPKWPHKIDLLECGHWSQCGSLIHHVLSLRQYYFRNIQILGYNRMFINLLSAAAWYLHERGEFAAAMEISEKCYAIDQNIEVPQIVRNLAAMSTEINAPEFALKYSLMALEIELLRSEQLQTDDSRHDLAVAYREVGVGYLCNNSFILGINNLELSIQEFNKLQDRGPFENYLSFINLALAYWLQGKAKEGEKVLRGLLAQGFVGTHYFKQARLLYALGNIEETLGDVEEAEAHHRKALHLFSNYVGPSHHRTADILCRVARHETRKERYERAIEHLLTAKFIWDAHPDFYRPDLARVNFMLSRAYAGEGDEMATERHLRIAWDLYQEIRPYDFRARAQLVEKDFDDLVTFWSK